MRSERLVGRRPGVRGAGAGADHAGAPAAAASTQIFTYLDPGGEILVSGDRHATLLTVVARPYGRRPDRGPDLRRRARRRQRRVRGAHHGQLHARSRLHRALGERPETGELQFGLPAALIVLLLVVGTLVGAAIPMMMAIISIVVALGVTARHRAGVRAEPVHREHDRRDGPGAGHRLLAVHRLAAARGAPPRPRHAEAILVVADTATRAVVFSGIAFTLAMIAMLLVPDTTLRSLGLGAVIVGLVSIVVALTFHPALLMVLGDRVDRLALPWLGRRIAASAGEEGPSGGAPSGGHAPAGGQPDRLDGRAPGARLPGARPAPGRSGDVGAARPTPSPSRAWSRWSATSRAAPPTRSTSSSTARPTTRGRQQGLTRLRAELAGDRDFAARTLTVETRPAHRRGLRAAHGRAEQRAGVGGGRPSARRLRSRRLRRGGGPRLRRRHAGRGARLLRGRCRLAADRDRLRARR